VARAQAVQNSGRFVTKINIKAGFHEASRQIAHSSTSSRLNSQAAGSSAFRQMQRPRGISTTVK
jgi:acyl-CoA synthetase (NDP forming)